VTRDTGVRRIATVDLDGLVANALALGDDARPTLLADARADALGHGLVPVARALDGLGFAGILVSDAEAELELRSAGVSSPVFVEGSQAPDAGIARDGLYGFAGGASAPIMRLTAEIVGAKPVRAGEGVSYGYSYRVAEDGVLALVGIGYADGVVRAASSTANVRIGGAGRADGGGVNGTIAGSISMDQFSVDAPGAVFEIGDDAVLFGSADAGEPTLRDWSERTGVPAAAITSRLSARVRREHVGGPAAPAPSSTASEPMASEEAAR